jgi:hypothetical protein
MPRRLAAPLPEALDLGERQVISREVQQRVQQRGAVTRRQHEAIAIEPLR